MLPPLALSLRFVSANLEPSQQRTSDCSCCVGGDARASALNNDAYEHLAERVDGGRAAGKAYLTQTQTQTQTQTRTESASARWQSWQRSFTLSQRRRGRPTLAAQS
eukprot:12843871-Alexandrium_andersonii.AAC.1